MLRSILFSAAGICLLTVTSCTSDHVAPCPDLVPHGIVQGRVNVGGVAATVLITAAEAGRQYANGREFRVQADSTGAYGLVLPIGNYFLHVDVKTEHYTSVPTSWYHEAGPPYSFAGMDTVHVTDDSNVAADFTLSSMVVTLRFPSEFLGRQAQVQFYRWGSTAYPETAVRRITSGTEVFPIPGIDPGFYRVKVGFLEYAIQTQDFWLPATRDSSEAALVEASPAHTSSAAFDYPDQPAILRGMVTGSWQHLVAATPMITLLSADSLEVAGNIPLDRDGSFESRIYLPVPVKILIEIAGMRRWYGGETFSQASIVDLQPGQTAPSIEVKESGLLLDLRDPSYQDIWRARVQLLDPHTLAVVREARVSGRKGSPLHGIANLDPGEYLLRIRPDPFLRQNWMEQWYDGVAGFGGATMVTIPGNGGFAQVQINLVEGGRISGTIWSEITLDSFGDVVYLTFADDRAGFGSMHPGEDCYCGETGWSTPHSYSLRGLPAGRYKVGVFPYKPGAGHWPADPPKQTIWYPAGTRWEDAAVFVVSGQGEVTGIDFDLR